MNNFTSLFLLFVFYSIIGWIIESISCSIFYKKILNRGFLVGPYCPIYGSVALLIIVFLNSLNSNIYLLFISSMVIASIIEYLVSFIMEVIFKARWWDYSRWPINLNGRVHLLSSIVFGLLGVVLIRVINPFISSYIASISYSLVLAVISFLIITIDICISSISVLNYKKSKDMLTRDCSQEFKDKIINDLKKASKI